MASEIGMSDEPRRLSEQWSPTLSGIIRLRIEAIGMRPVATRNGMRHESEKILGAIFSLRPSISIGHESNSAGIARGVIYRGIVAECPVLEDYFMRRPPATTQ